MKWQATEYKKKLVIHTSDNDSYSRYLNKLLQINKNKEDNAKEK